MGICKFILSNGKRCKRHTSEEFCYQHQKSTTLNPYESKKRELFEELKWQKISSKTINAMKKIKRELFIPEKNRSLSYENRAVPIDKKQTISQPYIVGHMIDQLQVNSKFKVLEIGTGSGYNLAILSKLVKKVVSIERIPELAENSKHMMDILKIKNVKIIVGDGTLGYEKDAPYDRIIITAGATKKVPTPLLNQLKIGGIMIIPKQDETSQEYLYKITKLSSDKYKTDKLSAVNFVPLIGKYGHK